MTKKKCEGLTLLELLMVLAITVALIVLSQSGLFSLLQKQQTQSAASTLLSSLAFAKSEAIMRQERVGLCGLSNEKTCSTDWSQGYQVFTLSDRAPLNVLRYFSSSSTVIHSQEQPMIIFNQDGRCLTRASLYINKNGHTQKIVIYDSGRARIAS